MQTVYDSIWLGVSKWRIIHANTAIYGYVSMFFGENVVKLRDRPQLNMVWPYDLNEVQGSCPLQFPGEWPLQGRQLPNGQTVSPYWTMCQLSTLSTFISFIYVHLFFNFEKSRTTYIYWKIDEVNGKWGEVLALINMENRGLPWKKLENNGQLYVICLWYW
jgi:hypothetical protein